MSWKQVEQIQDRDQVAGNEVATPRGFEPLISTVTGWHVSPLHYGAISMHQILWGVNNQTFYLSKVYQDLYLVSS